MKNLLVLFLLLFVAPYFFAHSSYENSPFSILDIHVPEMVFWLIVGFAIVVVIALISVIFPRQMIESKKYFAFLIIVAAVVLPTLYVVFITVDTNLKSVTGGPVHWHADYEVWVCGEKLVLEGSKGIEGKIGTNLLHHHNDYRIHVEGTVNKLSDVSLGEYFEVIGGSFSRNEISVILQDGSLLQKRNGDLCNGFAATVQLYVNGEKNGQFENYVLSHYSTVPPGDFIQIVFDSKEGVPSGS